MTPYLSKHSRERIEERTHLNLDDVAKIIAGGHGVVLEKVPGFNRQFVLFYSVPDQQHYVAVQDYLYSTIITVLPLAYHERINRIVSKPHLEMAKEIAYVPPVEQPKLSPNQLFYVRIAYSSKKSRKQHYVPAGEVSAEKYENDAEKLLADGDTLLSMVESTCEKQNLKFERIFGIAVEYRGNSKLFAFEHVYKQEAA